MDIYFALQSDSDGTPMTGQAANVTVYLSIDGGSFTASTNSAAEIGRGAYKVTLTSAEAAFSTLLYAPVCTGAQSNIYQLDAAPAIPSASDNAQAVWGAQTKEVTINSAQADTLATASSLSAVADNVSAVKAKTDNLPATPAATGDAMTLTSAYDAAKTASQFDAAQDAVTIGQASEQAIRYGLSTFNPATDAVTIATAQASTLATAAAQAVQTAAISKLDASILHWTATASTLTLYDNNGAAIGVYDLTRDSSGNITAIEPHVEG